MKATSFVGAVAALAVAGTCLGQACCTNKAAAGVGAKIVNVHQPAEAPKDIVDTAVAAGKFNTLAAALKAAGLVDTLKGKGPFTVFAPTDEAFAKLPKGTVESWLKPGNKDKLIAVLTYHVVAARAQATDVAGMAFAQTVNGQRVDLKTKDGKVWVANAQVVMADVAASNGVIHAIDTVLMPATADIVDTAMSAGHFNTLAAALKAAGLVDTLKGKGPFTVFAPTDEAFAKLPNGTIDDLLKPENKAKLASILTYHVVPGRAYADQVVAMHEGLSVQGSAIEIMVKDGKVMVGNKGGWATVTKTDIETSNGVIHVIDSVIMPK